ncbi:nucleotidyltransferase family protein [Prevotella sp. P5-50]|uniref:nucleotidyltransferase domain-containing protein n=1 Tax=Prevotella sp. P5-50 TaxID=2024217 RepID=UPI000B95E7CE|nr:nucleotidyltransferase family protein [Prevotella sp. P5-50]OYP41221.1 hypothetical protein CIK88_06735 [Prevotella sp. P5-50]
MRYDIAKEPFLTLIRLGLGHYAQLSQETLDWNALQNLATQQSLSAVLLDGIEKLPDSKRPPKELILQWIGEVLQGYEQRYELYRRAIANLAAFYNAKGVKMMILKGLACGMDWAKPEHRPYGDIDIWQFGEQKEADALIIKEKGIKVDTSHHHHTVFYWQDFMVENHYDFINVHHHKSSKEIEQILKDLGKDDSHSINVNGETIFLPSPNLHALFLLRHASSHFAAEGITLRQIIDWGFFVQANHEKVDWEWLENILEQYGMMEFYNIINAICVDDLGFNASFFTRVQFNRSLKNKVVNEILYPEYGVEYPKELFKRLVFKIRRWKGSAWKHRLCYKDSLWSALWRGVWAHLLKPSSI